ncbi:MAG: HD-GYP domain-containing protein (c-di-GMP phosphodiesterase class II) [Cellvibrionaceae bacterium]
MFTERYLSVKQIKININEVVIGMFIAGLDRSWAQTPFPIQGFYVRDMNEIKQLRAHCDYVYIDIVKGTPPARANLRNMPRSGNRKFRLDSLSRKRSVSVAPLRIKPDTYLYFEPLEKEVKRAKQLHQKVFNAVSEVMSQLNSGALVSAHETKRTASDMVDSIIRNPDAFTWLSRIRDADEYTYAHAVRSAVWAILFGRHIGLDKKELDTLAVGVLMKDIGKTHIPKSLLSKSNRNTQEQAEYESFVERSVEILRRMSGVEPRIIAVVKTHCERINGSGYPNHLRGDKIPLLGKIAGLVTFYDEITHPRGIGGPVAPSRAVSRLYKVRGIEFQEDLVVEFIRGIGLYPTGTLVELNTGEVGVIVEQNFDSRLKPKVALLLDTFKQPLRKPRLLNLAEDDRKKQSLVDAGKKTIEQVGKIEIAQDLEPGSYDINYDDIFGKCLTKNRKPSLFSILKNKLYRVL